MKLYIAGASREPERVRAAMEAAKALGHEITVDWLREIEQAGAANEGLTTAQRVYYANRDLEGVDEADLVWLLAPAGTGSAGAWVELGYALGLRSDRTMLRPLWQVIVSGSQQDRCIFTDLADKRFREDQEALDYLAELARTNAGERTNYVLCTWSGSRRARDKRLTHDPALYIRKHLESLQTLKHNLNQITVAVPWNPKEPRQFRRVINQLPPKIGGADVVVLERPNIGMSYGSLADAFDKYKSAFDFYFLMEDDYVFALDNFDRIHLDVMRENHDCGYLAGLIWDQRGNLPRHAGVSNGLLRTRALEAVSRMSLDRRLPHAPDDRYGANELYGQVGQSQAVIKAGFTLMDWAGKYRVLFRDARDVIQTFHPEAPEDRVMMRPV